MIEEVINDIRQAEGEGAKIVSDSALDAKALLGTAASQAEKLKRAAALKVKEDTKQLVSDAETQASIAREKIIADGKTAAQTLIKTKDKVTDEIAEFLLGKYLQKYGVKNTK